MVAFTDGKYDKKRSRLFKIKTASPGDDYGAIREVLTRRLTRAKEENVLPDLVMVDGGKAHLAVLENVAKALDIATVDLISIAKEKGKHTKGLTQEIVFTTSRTVPLSRNSPLLFLLQKIRDETHRRAIGFHRKRREKRMVSSLIEEIPGIGVIKRKRLLSHFGSAERVSRASDTDLLAVKGVTKKDITSIRQFFQEPLP